MSLSQMPIKDNPRQGKNGDGVEIQDTVQSARLKKGSLIIIIILLLAGIAAAWYLTMVKLQLQYHPDYISSCNYGERLNCDTVQTSGASEIFDIPIALFGLAVYLTMIFLAVFASTGGSHGQKALSALFSIGLATCVYSVYLAFLSVFVIKAVCTYCLLMYAISFVVTILSLLSLPRGPGSVFNSATYFSPFTSWPVVAGITVSFWVSFGGAYAFYTGKKTGMIADYIAGEEARVEQVSSSADEGLRQSDAAKTETEITPATTGRGTSFMMFPITEADHVKGPADAPVTIVQFADFGCSYCKVFSRNIAPLEKKYEGKTRWVFKHYPLDKDCNQRFRTTHPNACKGSRAAICASEQGKFWEAHAYFFDRASAFSDKNLVEMVNALKLDQELFNDCMNSNRPDAKIAEDVRDGWKARLSGTPRTYINGYLVSGNVGVEIMDYYIQQALTRDSTTRAAMAVPVSPDSRTPVSIPLKTTQKAFHIDTFEAAIDKRGRAVSMLGVRPAYASWRMAAEACERAGKRLCTEEEWVTACMGLPAVDNNGSGHFNDDNLEGWMFPYGPYYIGGRCHDAAPKEGGKIESTGSRPGCLSVQGVYDLTGNLAEWAISAQGTPVLLGGHLRVGQKASCAFAITGLGPGIRNEVTGFRCCSDNPMPAWDVAFEDIDDIPLGGQTGRPVMDFSFTDQHGREINKETISDGTTVITLFKSQHPLGKRELQKLQQLKEEFGPLGINFLGFMVDRDMDESKALVDAMPFKGPIHIDADQVSMGVFSARKIPSTYVVDGLGILRISEPGGMQKTFDRFKDKLKTVDGL